MTSFDEFFFRAAAMGISATLVMDTWLALLHALKVPTLNFAFLGRWVGHAAVGRWTHHSIAAAPPIPAERALGWAAHYSIGIGFAALLLLLSSPDWARTPTWWPALAFGVCSVAAPWFVMQPAMGAGLASSRTQTPALNRLRNLANHAVFGSGLYVGAWVAATLLGR